MADLPINYGDSGKVARDKINDSFNELAATVEGYKPQIINGVWWIGTTNTGVKAEGDSIVMKVEDGYIWYKSESNSWTKIIAVADLKGSQGNPGADGNGIASITSTKVGKTTTVTITETGGTVDTFQIQDGADGVGGDGDVKGPDSSTNGHMAVFDGATGKIIRDGGSVPTVPTKVSDLANDSGFITDAVDNLVNYYLKSETYTKAEVNSLISNFGGFEVVTTLPTQDIKTNVIYLKGPIGSGADKYEEYIYSNNNWILIGETSVDLTNYFNTSSQTSDAITEGTTNLFLTASERTKLGNTSGTNTGDQIASDFDIKDLADSTGLRTTWSGKQDELESGTNIKTINNQSLLGSGNITISGGGSDIEYVTQAEYEALLPGAASDGKHYFIYTPSVVPPSPWQPGANTMLYLPLETDLLDHSGNSLTVTNLGNVTLANVGLSFSVAQFNSTSTELTFSYQGSINSAWTMSFWENIENQSTDAMFVGAGAWSAHNLFQLGFTPRPARGLTLSDTSTDIDSGSFTGRDGSWHLITATYSGVGGQTNNAKVYIDGSLAMQGTMQGWNWNTNTFMVGNYNQETNLGGFLSKFIVETAERTAQEVADYFNLTKGDYGIS